MNFICSDPRFLGSDPDTVISTVKSGFTVYLVQGRISIAMNLVVCIFYAANISAFIYSVWFTRPQIYEPRRLKLNQVDGLYVYSA